MALMLYISLSSIALATAIYPSHSELNSVFRRSGSECLSGLEIHNCLKELPQVHTVADGVPLIEDESALNNFCSDLNKAKECIASIGKNCPETDVMNQILQKTFTGITDYTCSETGKEAILEERDCWKKAEVEREVQACATPDVSGSFDLCGYLTRFQNCTSSSIRNHCGARASRFVNNLVYHGLQPAAELYFGCGDAVHLDIADDLLSLLRRAVF